MVEKLCPECQAPNRNTARFCSVCGAPFVFGLSQSIQQPGQASSTSRLQSGAILQNRYSIETELGRGGFGAVYLAKDLSLTSRCVIKENLETSSESQRQFTREAIILANLSHPNLPRVTDYFIVHEWGQYLVMDFVEGQDLADMLRHQGRLPVDRALLWISQVADALEYMHSQSPSVIHRDIKPANIRVDPSGKALLVDFGLVKTYDPKLKTTMGARAVTPGFSPPEQYIHGSTDVRTDIYALGATLYNLITGEEPLESVQRVAGMDIVAADQLNPDVPAQVSRTIRRAMHLIPDQRYQSVAEFRANLRDGLAVADAQPVAPDEGQTRIVYSASKEVGGGTIKGPAIQVSAHTQSSPASISRKGALDGDIASGRQVEQNRKLLRIVAFAAALLLCILSGLAAWAFGYPLLSLQTSSTYDAQTNIAAQVALRSTENGRATASSRTEKAAQDSDIQVVVTSDSGAGETKNVNPSNTAKFDHSATIQALETATVQITVDATELALQGLLSQIKKDKELIFGPRDGLLVHDGDGLLETSHSTVAVRSFEAEVRIANPYSLSDGEWVQGLVFRSEGGDYHYRLMLYPDKTWRLVLNTGSLSGKVISEGDIPEFDTQFAKTNLVSLVVKDDTGWLFVNDFFLGEFDVSAIYVGSVYVAIFEGELPGQMTSFRDFTVWQLK